MNEENQTFLSPHTYAFFERKRRREMADTESEKLAKTVNSFLQLFQFGLGIIGLGFIIYVLFWVVVIFLLSNHLI